MGSEGVRSGTGQGSLAKSKREASLERCMRSCLDDLVCCWLLLSPCAAHPECSSRVHEYFHEHSIRRARGIALLETVRWLRRSRGEKRRG